MDKKFYNDLLRLEDEVGFELEPLKKEDKDSLARVAPAKLKK